MNLETVRAYGLTADTGILNKNARVRLVRNNKVIEDNLKLAGLRSFKKEVSEVKEGNECGLSFVNTYPIIKGDILEFYKSNQ